MATAGAFDQIGPISLKTNGYGPEVSGSMFNYKVFKFTFLDKNFEFRASRHLKLSIIAAKQPGDDVSPYTAHS
jgi:hypothetical protein